jgi:hypothetical protein
VAVHRGGLPVGAAVAEAGAGAGVAERGDGAASATTQAANERSNQGRTESVFLVFIRFFPV